MKKFFEFVFLCFMLGACMIAFAIAVPIIAVASWIRETYRKYHRWPN